MIEHFKSPEYAFLSNFAEVQIQYKGKTYASVEHAYMSAKSDDPQWKNYCSSPNITAADVKREGKTVKLVDNWDTIKFEVMEDCLRAKFNQEPFKSKLIATGNQQLQEGNWWGDRIWGVDLKVNPNVGENHLGRLLMKIRDEVRADSTFWNNPSDLVSVEEYRRITNCSSSMYMSLDFPILDIQKYLIRMGYKIIIHKAPCQVHEVTMDGGEVNRTGRKFEQIREAIFAIKPGDVLPERLDNDQANALNFTNVFRRIFYEKLMNL